MVIVKVIQALKRELDRAIADEIKVTERIKYLRATLEYFEKQEVEDE